MLGQMGERDRLLHFSEDPSIEVFHPHHSELHAAGEALVWAVESRYQWLYWFPRDCPRATFWAHDPTTDDDLERFLDGDRERRVHAIESDWLERMRTTRVYAYRMPAATFERHDRFWVSRSAVDPIELTELGDLLALHADAEIELRIAPSLLALWDRVVASTLDFSGIRLQNATLVQ